MPPLTIPRSHQEVPATALASGQHRPASSTRAKYGSRKAAARKFVPADAWTTDTGIIVTIPCYTTTEGNSKEHWRTKHARCTQQKEATAGIVEIVRHLLPCPVKLTRLSPGTLDAHDNLRSALKHVVDAIAELAGLPDNDARWAWEYAQEPSKAYGVRVELVSPLPSSAGDK